MDDLDDELDLRYHRGLNPEVYYRCPSLESLDGALRNELDKSAASLIPVEIVTEFVFATTSTITIPVTHQASLDSLMQPADYPQSMTVDHALCRNIEGKDRLRVQRAIARSFIDAFQDIDGFKYSERHVSSKGGGDGARFKYVCIDSFQSRNRRNSKKVSAENAENAQNAQNETVPKSTYDCGGAIHIKFSQKRDAINVIYKHNPIHRDVESRPSNNDSQEPVLATENGVAPLAANGTQSKKRKRSKKDQVELDQAFNDPDLDMSTSPDTVKITKKKRNKSSVSPETSRSSTKKKGKKSKKPESPSKSRKKASIREPARPPIQPVPGKCLRCREKKIKCNEAKPTCDQCHRGLWTCQYVAPGPKKRSKTGCLNCKQRKRKCTEERPSCAYCLKIDDDCMYAENS